MAGNQLSIANVINVSVSQAQTGLGEYNTSNLAIFTEESPTALLSDGYKIYLDPTDVATDFGTSSKTYKMANAIFSQQPNILAGGGYLVVIPFQPQVQTLAFSAVAASGTFTVTFNGNTSAPIQWDATADEIQTALRAVTGLEGVFVSGSIASQSVVVSMYGIYDNSTLVTATSSLEDGASAAVNITITQTTAAETLGPAITRTADLIQYFGIVATQIFNETDTLAAAAIIQPLIKMGFFVQRDSTAIDAEGILDKLRTNKYTRSRGLYYGSDNDLDAIIMSAAYAGRGLSVDFSGSLTTITMHLKDLTGVEADPTMTQTLLNKALLAGADTYVSIQGVAKVFTSGANSFFDQVYNLLWFIGEIQVAGFNYLATVSTKIPQTETGMDGLKGAYRQICEEAVTNGYVAAGKWNSPTTFGNLNDFLANVSQVGYYIYSQPVTKQSQADRADRKAPLVQIAVKEAGAIQSSNVIVYVNA